MTNPVLQALNNAKLAERESHWQRNEAAMLATLRRQFGDLPVQQTPAMVAALSAFVNWCEARGVRSLPAQPAAAAQFVLENAGLGSMPFQRWSITSPTCTKRPGWPIL
jgi:hypothetical protein